MAGNVRTNVKKGMVTVTMTEPTAATSTGIKVGNEEPASVSMAPLVPPLAAIVYPSWSDLSSLINTPKESSLSDSQRRQASQDESIFPKLFTVPSLPFFATESTNASQVPSTSPVDNIYVEEDEIEMDSGQLVPTSILREIQSSSPINPSLRTSTAGGPLPLPPLNLPTFNSPRSLYPPRVQMPMESRHFDVTYGYAETVEETTRIPSSTLDTTTPTTPLAAPKILVPLPPPDIIPPSSHYSSF